MLLTERTEEQKKKMHKGRNVLNISTGDGETGEQTDQQGNTLK